jgi:hypothetical protein
MIPEKSMQFPLSSATHRSDLTILSLYIHPSGEFNQFINSVHGSVKYLYNPQSEFVICGNIKTILIKTTKKTTKLINNIKFVTQSNFCGMHSK